MSELIWSDATAQARAIRGGEVSAEELMVAYLGRIERLDDRVRAYVTVDADGALAAARAADARRHDDPDAARPFGGVALSIKDLEDVGGLRTTHSCEALADHIAPCDSPVVRRLRDAGFAMIGKTNVPEFGTDMTVSKLNGTCRNPWDLSLTPGGSSGGAAASIAAGMCALAHGTDGAGSVRVPSSFCGVIGLKATRGLMAFGPDEGSPFFANSGTGPLARSVRDVAGFLDAVAPMGGWTPARPRPFSEEVQLAPPGLRVAVCTTFPAGEVAPECSAAAEEAGRAVEALGHHVEVAAPDWEVILAASVLPVGLATSAVLVPPEQAQLIEPRNQGAYQAARAATVLGQYHAVEGVRAASAAFLGFWDTYDVLITPTAGWLPPPVEWARWDDDAATHRARFAAFPNFAQPFNVSGQPAISLPLGWTDTGFPVGVQLAGRKLEEGLLLRLAARLEEAHPWQARTVAAGRALG